MPSKGVTHPYPARALMADLDFMGYRRVIHKSDQEPSIDASGHGEIVPEASPTGESKRNGKVERAVQSVHGLARTLKDFLEQLSGITLESRSPMFAWLVDLVPIFFCSSTRVSRTTVTQPTCVRRASPGELSCRALVSALTTGSAVDTSWSRSGREVCSLVLAWTRW